MTDTTGGSPYGSPDGQGNGEGRNATAREWMAQLQSMIDNVATNAGPIMRDVAAKAAELAAVAGEKAGPIAHKAAEVTEAAGAKLAERGREVAAELRRDQSGTGAAGSGAGTSGGAATGDAPNSIDPAPASGSGNPGDTTETVGQ